MLFRHICAGLLILCMGSGASLCFAAQESESKQDDTGKQESTEGNQESTEGGQDEGAPKADPMPQEAEGGQDETTNETPEEKFERLYQKWQELAAEARSTEEKFRDAPESDKQPLRVTYNNLVAELQSLLPELTTATLDVYRASDAPDANMNKLLLGMMINDAVFSRDREALEIAQLLTEKGCPKELFEQARDAKRLGPFSREVIDEAIRRYDEFQANDLPRVSLETSKGVIELELFENEAPNTVANFISLIDKGFYDGLTFHRVLEDFVAQGGDPEGTGRGGPGYTIKCECYVPEHRRHFPGVVAMAHSPLRDTGGSQFYLTLNTYNRLSHANLDGKHTVFGRVISGHEILDLIQRRDPNATEPVDPDKMVKVTVTRRRDHPYEPVVTPNEGTEDPNETPEDDKGGDSDDKGSGEDAGSGDSKEGGDGK